MSLRIGDEAAAEIRNIVRYYREDYPGRAGRFLSALRAAIELAEAMPNSGFLRRRLPTALEVRTFRALSLPASNDHIETAVW